MVIINATTYNEIVKFLSSYKGLSIECEEEIVRISPQLPRDTIRSIISKHGQNALKIFFYKYSSRSDAVTFE